MSRQASRDGRCNLDDPEFTLSIAAGSVRVNGVAATDPPAASMGGSLCGVASPAHRDHRHCLSIGQRLGRDGARSGALADDTPRR